MADEPAWWVQPAEDEVWDVTDRSDWEELVAVTQPGGGSTFARDDASATLVGHIPTKKEYDARKKMLGATWCDSDSPWALHRLNPMTHPKDEQLRVATVDFCGFNPQGKLVPSGDDAPLSPPPPPFPPQPVLESDFELLLTEDGDTFITEDGDTFVTETPPPAYSAAVDAIVTGTFPTTINYTRQIATVKFAPSMHPYLSDAQMEAGSYPEYYRNAVIFDTCDPIIEALAADVSTPWLKWKDRPAGGGEPTINTSDGLNKGSFYEIISKATIVLAWFHVPYDFVCDPYLPSKILSCVGCLNDEDDWLADVGGDGFPARVVETGSPEDEEVGSGSH